MTSSSKMKPRNNKVHHHTASLADSILDTIENAKKESRAQFKKEFKNLDAVQKWQIEHLYIQSSISFTLGEILVGIMLGLLVYGPMMYILSNRYEAALGLGNPAGVSLIRFFCILILGLIPAAIDPDFPFTPIRALNTVAWIFLKLVNLEHYWLHFWLMPRITISDTFKFGGVLAGAIASCFTIAWYNGTVNNIGQPSLLTVEDGGQYSYNQSINIMIAWAIIQTAVTWRAGLWDLTGIRLNPKWSQGGPNSIPATTVSIIDAVTVATGYLFVGPIIGAPLDITYALATAAVSLDLSDTPSIAYAYFVGWGIGTLICFSIAVYGTRVITWLKNYIDEYEEDSDGNFITQLSNPLRLKPKEKVKDRDNQEGLSFLGRDGEE